MRLEGLAEEIMASMQIASPHHLKTALRREGHSGYVYAQKLLNNLVNLGKLERRGKLYALPSCKSEGKDHALAVTEHIAQIFNQFDNPVVYREKLIEEIALRPDILAFIRKERNALCMVLEIVDTETEQYLQMKRTTWERWDRAADYLSDLFGQRVRWFDFVTSQDFLTYLKEM